jgi:hypothetical protein
MKRKAEVKRRMGAMVLGLASLAGGVLLWAPSVRADDAAVPARAVRLSSVDGRVQILQGGQVLADPAVANTPLFEGTQVVTEDDGRAEIQFEDGSMARLSPNSSLTLSVLTPTDSGGGAEIVMQSGLGYIELQGSGQAGPIRLRFGDSAVTASGFTVLRIDLDNAPGELAVFSGNAHLERGSALALDLHGGESVTLNRDLPSQYNLAETIEPDSWDSWNSDRDQVISSEAASKTEASGDFVNNSNPAWNDLDANGNWYNVPDQGYVWSPYDAASQGWDPYGNGYWMYTPRFGYMWVSGDSWGYLPSSCGLWSFYSGFGWGWAPGVGSCNPWWGGGYYEPNIGFSPIGYRPPLRPRPPRFGNGGPIKGGNRFGPYPVVVVKNRPPSGDGGQAPRARSGPVTIAGHVVEPLRPISTRPVFDHVTAGIVSRPAAPVAGNRAPYLPEHGSIANPVAVGGGRPVAMPAPRAAPAPRAYSPPPPSRSYSGGGAPSRAPSAPSAPSGGGGGGHPSGGSHH